MMEFSFLFVYDTLGLHNGVVWLFNELLLRICPPGWMVLHVSDSQFIISSL